MKDDSQREEKRDRERGAEGSEVGAMLPETSVKRARKWLRVVECVLNTGVSDIWVYVTGYAVL